MTTGLSQGLLRPSTNWTALNLELDDARDGVRADNDFDRLHHAGRDRACHLPVIVETRAFTIFPVRYRAPRISPTFSGSPRLI